MEREAFGMCFLLMGINRGKCVRAKIGGPLRPAGGVNPSDSDLVEIGELSAQKALR